MNWKESAAALAPTVLRVGIAGVFLWFGSNQLFDPTSFVGYLPPWTASTGLSDTAFVMLNGIFELLLGLFLIAGCMTRLVALGLAVHLLGIAFSLGYNDIMIRDLGLVCATIVIALQGPSTISADKKLHARWMGKKWSLLFH